MHLLKKKITNDFLVYATATYITQALGILTSLAMRYFLEPSIMGVWSILDLVLAYSLYSSLGVLTALTTELPYYVGRGELDKAKETRNVSFSFNLASSIFVSFLFILWACFFGAQHSSYFRWGIIMLAFVLVSTSLYNFYISLMWAEKNFSLLGKAIVVNAAVYLILVFVLVPQFKLAGLLTTAMLSALAAALFLHIGSKPKLSLELNMHKIKEHLKIGLPLMAAGLSYLFFMGVDRIMIAKFLDVTAVGHYSIAILVVTYSNTIPKLLATVVFPSLQERYGKTGSHKETSSFITKPTILLSYSMPGLLGLAYFTAPYLVAGLLPKYVPGLTAMRIMILGTYFLSLSQPVQSYLTTIYKRLHLIPIVALGAGSAIAISYYLILKGYRLSGVAAGMSFGFFVYYSVLLFYVFRHFFTLKQTAAFYGETFLCFVYFVGMTVGIDKWIHFPSGLLEWLSKCLIFCVFCLPLLWIVNKKTQAVSIMWLAVHGYFKLKLKPSKEGYEAQV